MTDTSHSTANPFYSSRRSVTTLHQLQPATGPVYARLPKAPQTASPVPHLTSLYHFDSAGDYGDRRYPGNCGGNLIRDLLQYFKPSNVFDPMTGSGTCQDVCRELGIPCTSLDIRHGFDATDPASYAELSEQRFDFVWAHPPYWRQKLYTDQPGDLSRTPTLNAFLDGYAAFIQNCSRLLAPHGRFAILMGDYQAAELMAKWFNGMAPPQETILRPPASERIFIRQSSELHGATDPVVITALTYIRGEIQRKDGRLRIEQIAAAAGVPAATLTRHFNAQLRKTPHKLIVELRLDMASELLKGTTKNIHDIAEQCGFCSASHLGKALFNKFGSYPGDYRRKHQEGMMTDSADRDGLQSKA